MPVDDDGVPFLDPDLADLEQMMQRLLPPQPATVKNLLILTALGITKGTWRNSPVEDWHAEGRISDGEMMRVNAYTTYAVHKRMLGMVSRG